MAGNFGYHIVIKFTHTSKIYGYHILIYLSTFIDIKHFIYIVVSRTMVFFFI